MTRLWKWLVWALDLDDGGDKGSPSLTKWLALVFGVLVVYSVWAQKALSATHVTLASVALSAAFGRSVWKAWLGRASFGLTARAEHRTEDVTVRQILERRDPEQGVEPTP